MLSLNEIKKTQSRLKFVVSGQMNNNLSLDRTTATVGHALKESIDILRAGINVKFHDGNLHKEIKYPNKSVHRQMLAPIYKALELVNRIKFNTEAVEVIGDGKVVSDKRMEIERKRKEALVIVYDVYRSIVAYSRITER